MNPILYKMLHEYYVTKSYSVEVMEYKHLRSFNWGYWYNSVEIENIQFYNITYNMSMYYLLSMTISIILFAYLKMILSLNYLMLFSFVDCIWKHIIRVTINNMILLRCFFEIVNPLENNGWHIICAMNDVIIFVILKTKLYLCFINVILCYSLLFSIIKKYDDTNSFMFN